MGVKSRFVELREIRHQEERERKEAKLQVQVGTSMDDCFPLAPLYFAPTGLSLSLSRTLSRSLSPPPPPSSLSLPSLSLCTCTCSCLSFRLSLSLALTECVPEWIVF